MLRGNKVDTTMNYRLRDAVIGLLAPQAFDPKGFPDSGSTLRPSQFLNRLASVREDYADATYYSLLNLLDSHDTERILWSLTQADNTNAAKTDPSALAAGKRRLQLAALIQFTQAGMPTMYYGDEVGMTGGGDPDSRRDYPWADLGGNPDTSLYAYYQTLTHGRSADGALTAGDFKPLLADDAHGTVAYGRKTATRGGFVALNVSDSAQTVAVPVADYLPDGVRVTATLAAGIPTGATASVSGGVAAVTLPAHAGAWFATGSADLAGPAASTLSVSSVGNGTIGLAWTAVPGATSYDVFTSPVAGGGYVRANDAALTGTSYTISGLANATTYHLIVRAVDAAGNLGTPSNDVSAVPHLTIDWANLQWPSSLTGTISAVNSTDDVYGQVYVADVTAAAGQAPGIRAQAGFGPRGTAPNAASWTWAEAVFNTQAGNNDEYKARLPLTGPVGSYDYVYRYSTDGGTTWTYADRFGPIDGGGGASQPGTLTVTASSDTTPAPVPGGLRVSAAGPSDITVAWDAVVDPTLYGYQVGRRDAGSSGAYAVLGTTTSTSVDPTSFDDGSVTTNAAYDYAVRSVDTSMNLSAWSAPVSAVAEVRNVTATFTVTVPTTTDASAHTPVHIAGTLAVVGGSDWDPSAGAMTRLDATHWTIALTGREGTQLQYKYALGDWTYVEKDSTCGEIGNRTVTLSYGAGGTMTVADNVANWRNVSPCGN